MKSFICESKTGFQLLLTLIIFFLGCTNKNPDYFENYSWIGKIRDDHPRIFFNKHSFKEVKARALNDERELFDEMKKRIDQLIGQKIEFKDPLVEDGTQNSDHEYGTRAAEAAFLYLVLKDQRYLDLTKNLLKSLVDYYELRNANNLNIQWYAFSRINALAAYDWIYEHLTNEEKIEIGKKFLYAINYMLPSKERKPFFRENTGDITTGFYGPPCLAWYAGLVFYNESIDDSLSVALLKKGYDDHTALLKYRSDIAGDDGGAASAVLGYCMGAYPWAEFNFFHTFNSATGLDISGEWPYVPSFINYIFWNWLPGDRQFGYGDSNHYENELPVRFLHVHLSQMVHFYGNDQLEIISMARWMQTKVKRQPQDFFPYARFLLNTNENLISKPPSENLPTARFFENMGQLFMRSGSGENDTYALFTAGGILKQHRHYDNNNFIIYKNGFLAMDTGTRPQPGLHLSHYYARTIAHNTILIRMPGEKMPNYWGGPSINEDPLPVPNDGGQNSILGSEVIAFDENKSYVYVASDATKSYHQDKCKLALRQFVFVVPDYFIIFDKVNSTDASYPKTWLLHTAKEPVFNGNEFYADHWKGRLFGKTLYPENAKIEKIGGPGKQFWSDGRNWPLPKLTPDDWNYQRMKMVPDTHELLGQWRVEVSPDKFNTNDFFLHFLQASDTTVISMSKSSLVKTEDMLGVRFVHGSRDYEILFATGDETGGKISITENGQKIMEEEFSDIIKPQSGLR